MNLKRRQELSLDGIETSLVMAKICYSRLHQTIEQYSRLGEETKTSSDFQNLILLDAWSLIDVIHRLRILVTQTPGLKKNAFIVSFQKATLSVATLRDFVQHLNSEIPKVEDTGRPIWGSLSWVYVSPEMQVDKKVRVMAIIPGRLARSKGHPIVNPVGKKIQPPVDHISLTASDTTINLSELFHATMQFGTRLEIAMAQAKETHQDSDDEDDIIQITLS